MYSRSARSRYRERIGRHEPQSRAEGVGLGGAHTRPHAGGGRRGTHLADGAGAAVERRERQRRASHRHSVLVRGDRQIEPGDVDADQHRGERWYANVCSIASGRLAADAGWVPRALPLRLLVAVFIAVSAVIITAGPLRSQLAGQGIGGSHSLVAPGPFTQARALAPLAPSLPQAGPNGAAIWVHGDRSPAAAVALLRAAGIPATVVHRFDNAARHPLVLSWPRTRLGARGGARACGRTCATAARFSQSRRARPYARPSVRGTPPSSPASCRCRSAAS